MAYFGHWRLRGRGRVRMLSRRSVVVSQVRAVSIVMKTAGHESSTFVQTQVVMVAAPTTSTTEIHKNGGVRRGAGDAGSEPVGRVAGMIETPVHEWRRATRSPDT